ncbi:hypothetical protein GC163_23710 [bacterium]|nr:hypothetical protein [bacterium]
MTSVDDRLVSDWRRRFQVARQLPAQGAVSSDSMSETFRFLTRRTRDVHRSPWVTEPALKHLQLCLQQTLNLTQILLEELPQAGDCRWQGFWNELAGLVDRQLHEIEQQIAACELIHEGSERLQELVFPVIEGRMTSGLELINFAKEWQSVLKHQAGEFPLIFPDPSGLAVVLANRGETHTHWLVHALLSAQFVSALTPVSVLYDEQCLLNLTVASLTQDWGAWHAACYWPKTDPVERQLARREPAHPAIGASVLAGLTDLPAFVTLLVGTHHERLDGTGYPQRISGPRFRPAMQWLAIIVRFVELLTDPVTSHMATGQNERLLNLTAVRFWREVRRGAFAEPLARQFLDAIEPRLSEQIANRFADHLSRLVDSRHDIPAPLGRLDQQASESAETVVPPPAFLRRQSGQRPIGQRLTITPKPTENRSR